MLYDDKKSISVLNIVVSWSQNSFWSIFVKFITNIFTFTMEIFKSLINVALDSKTYPKSLFIRLMHFLCQATPKDIIHNSSNVPSSKLHILSLYYFILCHKIYTRNISLNIYINEKVQILKKSSVFNAFIVCNSRFHRFYCSLLHYDYCCSRTMNSINIALSYDVIILL